MAERKGISKKLRFEVFKRDSFTCQYCGQMSPNVLLEIDHINPVKNNGGNDILNLVTSCFDCNRGKGKRKLSENQTLIKQQQQLKELNEKRNQLKLMVQWKKELENFENEQVNQINKLLESVKISLSSTGKDNCKRWIKKFGFDEVYESTNISIKQYYVEDNQESINKIFFMIPKICNSRLRSDVDPHIDTKFYIRGILRNRIQIYNENRLFTMLHELINQHHNYSEEIKTIAKTCYSWSDFWNQINDYFGGDY